MTRRVWERPSVQVAAVAVASALVAGAVALALRPDEERQGATTESEPQRPAGTPAAVRSRFRVFRSPRRLSDRVSIDPELVRRNGLDVALGRRVRGAPRTFAVPGADRVCVFHARAGGSCTPAAFAGRDFQVHSCGHVPTGRFELSGLVPDGVEAALLRLRDRRRLRLRISRSFVRVRRTARRRGDLPAAVELERGGAVRRVRVPPLRLSDLACERRN